MGSRDIPAGPPPAPTQGKDTALNAHNVTVDEGRGLLTIALGAGGATGAADDVDVFPAAMGGAPFSFRIIEHIQSNNDVTSGSTIQARTATGGGGSALAGAVGTATAGLQREATGTYVARGTVAKGATFYLRRSDRAVTGDVIMRIQRTA